MSTFVSRFALGSGPVRVAVKDTVDVAGHPSRAGSAALADAPAATLHAAVVQALLDNQGYTLIGKTNLHEFAFGITGVNGWTGTPTNPRFPGYIPGGSSSGSAVAVAAGDVELALGTDTGGSVRMPAACCGVIGFKPTFGRISRRGVMPAETTLDCVGPMADRISDLTQAMAALDSTFNSAMTLAQPTLGWVPVVADERVRDAVQQYLQQSQLPVENRALPGMTAAFRAGLTLINRETWLACKAWIDHPGLGEDVRRRLQLASETTDEAVAAAEAVRAEFSAEVDAALEGVTALVMPTLPNPPLTLADALAGHTDLTMTALIRPFNLSGHPALTLPVISEHAFPIGLQLIGRKGEDDVLCALAAEMVQALPDQAQATSATQNKTH